jgi:hypothetical protein
LAHSAWHRGWYDDAGGVSPACKQIHSHSDIIIKTASQNPAHLKLITLLYDDHLRGGKTSVSHLNTFKLH